MFAIIILIETIIILFDFSSRVNTHLLKLILEWSRQILITSLVLLSHVFGDQIFRLSYGYEYLSQIGI